SSAMLYVFMEGLVGIVDQGFLFNKIKLSPRWAATNVTRATAQIGYGASVAGFKYEFELQPNENKIILKLDGAAKVSLHVLLPAGRKAEKVLRSGKSISFQNVKVEHSNYVDVELNIAGEKNAIIILT
ncbi:MAG TPA: hypothetical protein VGD14_19665, partial [bacterium]